MLVMLQPLHSAPPWLSLPYTTIRVLPVPLPLSHHAWLRMESSRPDWKSLRGLRSLRELHLDLRALDTRELLFLQVSSAPELSLPLCWYEPSSRLS